MPELCACGRFAAICDMLPSNSTRLTETCRARQREDRARQAAERRSAPCECGGQGGEHGPVCRMYRSVAGEVRGIDTAGDGGAKRPRVIIRAAGAGEAPGR